MKKLHTYIHTYILACLIFGSVVNADAYPELSERLDFINLMPQQLAQEHNRQASLGQADALIEARYININLDGLNIIEGRKGQFRNIRNTQMSGQEISIQLPNVNKPVLLTVETVQNLIAGEDVVTYTGYVSDNRNDFFTMSIAGDGVMARINYGKYVYIITPLSGDANKHSVAQLDKSLMIKDTSDDVARVVESKKLPKAKNHVEKSSNGSGNVKVLLYYASDVQFPTSRFSFIIANMNAILSRSGVSLNNGISSAGFKNINSTFSGQCKNLISMNMQLRNGVFSNLDQDLLAYGADVMFLLISDDLGLDCSANPPFGDSVLWGRLGGLAFPYTSTQAHALSTANYALGDFTAIHEFGHVFDGVHNNLNFSSQGFTGRNRGLTHPSGKWQTMMGSYGMNNCNFSSNYLKPYCERIGYFSNPNVFYEGVATGSSSRDMKSHLEITMPVVSSWRGSPIPPPAAPDTLSVNNQACYGFNTVHWTSQPGADEYRLYKSTNPNFTNPTLVYAGSSLMTAVNVNFGTWYLRAKACSASGCSAYSNQATAQRINSCL